MLLSETKEREYRFALALRIGLPIFSLVLLLISTTLLSSYENLSAVFYVESLLLLAFCIYFIFYILYNGFEVQITDGVTKAFSREYFYKYLKKEIKDKKTYTLFLFSIDNIDSINKQYGIANADKIKRHFVEWIEEKLLEKEITKFPLGHIKYGDFMLGLSGAKEQYFTLMELISLKLNEYKFNTIEVNISSAIVDTKYSNDLEYLVDKLYEFQTNNTNARTNINTNDLEHFVIESIKKNALLINTQEIMHKTEKVRECFVRLVYDENKFIYPKTYIKILAKYHLESDFYLILLQKVILKAQKSEWKYALNMAPSLLRDEQFFAKLKNMIEEAPLAFSKMYFILYESEYYSFTSRYNTILNYLRKKGICIVVDKFGSFHTSFLYLKNLHIDAIRFDGSYSNCTKLEENSPVIEGLSSIARSKKVQTWVKNIEEKKTFDVMKKFKIDYLQGKYISEVEK